MAGKKEKAVCPVSSPGADFHGTGFHGMDHGPGRGAGPLKIGRISYLNLYPIFRGLEKTVEREKGRYRFFDGHPAMVNAKLRKGYVDASPSSSIVYLKNPADYRLIEGHSISSDGPIRSIYLFSTLPIKELGGRTIGVTNQTETSAALLKIVSKKFFGVDFRTRVSRLPVAGCLQKYGACLSIGDDAMIAFKRRGKKGGPAADFVYDLGLIWKEKTGLPFVYALWIARKDSAVRQKEAFAAFRRHLDQAKLYALEHLEEASREKPLKGLAPEEILLYWRGISYGLGPMEKKGLAQFRKFAKELGLLEA